MRRTVLERVLADLPQWQKATQAERTEFAKATRGYDYCPAYCMCGLGRHYNQERLEIAAAFFLNGWRRAKNDEPVAAVEEDYHIQSQRAFLESRK